ETVTFTITAHYSDATPDDNITAQAELLVSDDTVLKVYVPPEGQPLLDGTVTVRGLYGGQEDEVEITITMVSAGADDLVINEILADGEAEGDPNGDGKPNLVQDEFLEIGNAADATVDLSGVTITEPTLPGAPRHTFAEDTLLQAGQISWSSGAET
ncbi:MAG: lamin tail domain-containing protein, partial [Deltaproteobacteria bacterium]|nr:lamin tail domain-containing protein [Deltaproteobacteria bacterium]